MEIWGDLVVGLRPTVPPGDADVGPTVLPLALPTTGGAIGDLPVPLPGTSGIGEANGLAV